MLKTVYAEQMQSYQESRGNDQLTKLLCITVYTYLMRPHSNAFLSDSGKSTICGVFLIMPNT